MMMEEVSKLNPSSVKETDQNLLEQNGGIKRNIIYADPPWEYTIKHHEKGTTMNGLATQHYSTMSLKKLNCSQRLHSLLMDHWTPNEELD
jgi:hypothetical protein